MPSDDSMNVGRWTGFYENLSIPWANGFYARIHSWSFILATQWVSDMNAIKTPKAVPNQETKYMLRDVLISIFSQEFEAMWFLLLVKHIIFRAAPWNP